MFSAIELQAVDVLTPEWIVVRRERQTFTRLEESLAVVFTVRTTMTRLTSLDYKDLNGLAKEIRAWSEDVATYRRYDIWGDTVLHYCDRRCAEMAQRNDLGEFR